MALKATVFKAQLQISDMDRHYYETHALTLARHPSESDERMMVRLLAFAWFADPALAFTKGLCADDEPELWQHSAGGEIERWIDLGQPNERRVRKACGRAREVVLVNYGGRAADIWWQQNAGRLAQLSNLTVMDIPAEQVRALTALVARTMELQCTIEDAHAWLGSDRASVEITPTWRQRPGA